MSFTDHRKKILDRIQEKSIVIVYAGKETYANEDHYLKFSVNSQFFWLTGLDRPGMVLLLTKLNGITEETLFIDPFDPLTERWTGKMPTKEQVTETSGISNVKYTNEFESSLNRIMTHNDVRQVYFDTFRGSSAELPQWNLVKAQEFVKAYPAVQLKDLHAEAAELRIMKDAEEIADIRRAIEITKHGLEYIMENIKPGKYEYQVEADFEYRCRYDGMKELAFTTIAGSGINGCMMHYVDNDRQMEDGDMILLDLGAAYKHYCSDITRVYPANGKYSPRQREYYELVLKANKEIIAAAKPGVKLKDLNEVAKRVISEGLIRMGKIETPEEIGKYLMHGVSHSMGVDVHDINLNPEAVLQPGWVITNEPGVYVDEECIGIRIEDDLLITENGCEVLSKDIIKEVDDIEAYMAAHNVHFQ